jgi:anti-sigma factor ChrR (cupin superfamily)
MITEQQQEQAALCALGLLPPDEERQFADDAQGNPELRELLWSLQKTIAQVVLTGPAISPPAQLKSKVLERVRALSAQTAPPAPRAVEESLPGLKFRMAAGAAQWKALPVPGAFIKLLSLERDRGYAVLLGKLDPGTRYPAHTNAGPEDFYILTGDLQVSGRNLGPGDFHHADAGSFHEENYSIEGCTLLAVLTLDDPLVSLAMA